MKSEVSVSLIAEVMVCHAPWSSVLGGLLADKWALFPGCRSEGLVQESNHGILSCQWEGPGL